MVIFAGQTASCAE